jgi:GH43 family beta-xylosidase
LSYESGYDTKVFDCRQASSSSPTASWVANPKNPFLATNGQLNQLNTATPDMFIINGNWYQFFCFGKDHLLPFGTNHWQMAVAPLMKNP